MRHDPRTVAKVLGRGLHKNGVNKNTHGGTRRDILGDDGRLLLFKLVKLFPQTSDKWRAYAMSRVLRKEVRIGVVRSACKRLDLTSHKATVLYSECAAGRASHCEGRACSCSPTALVGPCPCPCPCPASHPVAMARPALRLIPSAVRVGVSRRRCSSSSRRL